MTEKISHYCCVCGARLPGLTAYELVQKGAGTYNGDGSITFHCLGNRHTPERIADAAKFAPGFQRGSEVGR